VLALAGATLVILCGIVLAFDWVLLMSPEGVGSLAILTFPLPGFLLGLVMLWIGLRLALRAARRP